MKQPYGLAPDDRADNSTRKILCHLLGELRSNVGGVVEDADIEFLHDLRVANRRTRSALSQIKGVLPASVLDTFQPEFKWLGDVTGPCRDLDVFLLAMDGHRQRLEFDGGVIGPLEYFLREKRQTEHALIRTALQSERFQRLVEDWDRFLNTRLEEESRPPLASTQIIEVAGPRILKAFRRIRKRGTGIDADPSADLLHRIRIDAKKLRYLLEFFSDLYPRTTVTRFVRELKQLQDILGDFNDTEVQLALIREYADHGTASAETLAATKRLNKAIEERQRQLRAECVERFELFAGDESRKLYKKTFKTR
jgi:CHAD domain-containing protein